MHYGVSVNENWRGRLLLKMAEISRSVGAHRRRDPPQKFGTASHITSLGFVFFTLNPVTENYTFQSTNPSPSPFFFRDVT